ncbi:MAG: efflux RND transporter periplasmic adaptor subunit [Bacteroidales bacterium]|jgi:Cu(I)/Ag(I) efflux system membrane fusion protein|nr:efflux RND transporter periplasmic adaptor subunit [Bacteroidales bacterium]
MKAKKIFLNKYTIGIVLLFVGLFLGWLFFYHSSSNTNTVSEQTDSKHYIWTCSMHPQIRKDKPGQCPICGMNLIPLQNQGEAVDSNAVAMSESAMKLAEVQTSIVGRGRVIKEVKLFGKIQADETLLQSQTANISGRIDKLYINITGENIRKGQLIAKIYSPELVTAQKELLEAVTMKDKYPAILDAAREKLRLWKLNDKQIESIEKSGVVISSFDIYSSTSGVLVRRKVNEGDYVNKGSVLFDVADLSQVWGVFDAYESDLAWISMGQNIDFTAQAIPGKVFKGNISFIDPVIDPVTRVTRVRIEIANYNMQFKPEMFLNGIVQAKSIGPNDQLIVPQSAVLWTGTRSLVYVKLPNTDPPAFKMREITLGASLKDSYVVLDGLKEGEEIVTNGTFSVDAAAQLAGKPSMMNPKSDSTKTQSPKPMDGMKM